jgi:hypothetical protein
MSRDGRDQTLRFYVDETSMGLGKAMALLRRDVVHPGHRRLPQVRPGTKDPDWMPVVAALGLIVISRDRHIRSKPAELAAFHAARLRAFWIGGRKDLSNWDSLARLIRHWGAMEDVIVDRGAGPWFYAVNEGAFSEIRI